MSDAEIKVSDKRIFTADGRLKEEYRFLEDAAAPRPPAAPAPEPPALRPEPPPRVAPAAPPELSPSPLEGEGPSFFDLLALLAEPASVYLGDVPLPEGQSAQDLDLARFHIDLLALLKAKTAGNLTAEEDAVLDDLVYQLRMRYLEKRG